MGAEPVLITGGVGFLGTNLARRLLAAGTPVRIYDNLSRPGVLRNLEELRALESGKLQVIIGDVRDREALVGAVRGAAAVFHFAAQVAVTTSLIDPIEDFRINAGGTLNLLECLRGLDAPPPLLFTSTNGVYGRLADIALVDGATRYEPASAELRARGIGEDRPVEFHTPFGCSKGSAEQYVSDYARTFGLTTTVFRTSCVYGPHQLGCEDEGWLAHFLVRALAGEPVTLYGDGKQVRDLLFVDDLVDAFLVTLRRPEQVAGRTFNLGGGPGNTVSLLELLDLVAELTGRRPVVERRAWRTADLRYYVSDVSRFGAATGWKPTTPLREGVARLVRWLAENVPAPALAPAGAPAP